MKKKILLLSAVGAVGAAAGLVYALETNRRKNKTADDESDTKAELSDNGQGPEALESSQKAASMSKIERDEASAVHEAQPAIDDQGTDQVEASHILSEIRDSGFEGSDEKLALALGRPTEEIEQWTSGNGLIDGDVLMKARALAIQRGLGAE